MEHHSPHTFRSIPFSQFRRAVVLCPDPQEMKKSIDYISEKLRNSGFHEDEIRIAREKAETLNRAEILNGDRKKKNTEGDKQMTFLINRNGFMCTKIKEILRDSADDINELLGETQLMVAERKNCNIASTVFAKSVFSKCNSIVEKDHQRCGKKNCKLCSIMNLPRKVTLWDDDKNYRKDITLDYLSDCSTECVIYLYVCNICKNNRSF